MKTWAKQTGFTIVELLIVIVVIGILAVITLVAYNGIKAKAQASAVTSALAQAAKQMALYQVDNGSFPATLPSTVTTSSNVDFQYKQTGSGSGYCITGTSGTTSYKVTNTDTPSLGGCPGHGVGGVAALTNLIVNPSAVSSIASYNGWCGNGGGSCSVASVSAPWAVRGKAARTTWTVDSTNNTGDIGWSFSNVSGSVNSLQPNTQYTARWRVNVSKSQRIYASIGNWCAVGGASGTGTGSVNASSGTSVIPANTPTEQWITFTTGPNTVCGKMLSGQAGGTGASPWLTGDWIEISELMVVQGSTKYNYADGSSTDLGWEWNGTANSSTSTGPTP